MNSIEKALIISLVALTIVVGIMFLRGNAPSYGNAITQGIVPRLASDSIIAVGPQQVITLAAKASNCTARIISTASTSLMLSFGTITPSATQGTWQGASTTVSYDNAVYGCGAITAYSPASSTVSVSLFAQ